MFLVSRDHFHRQVVYLRVPCAREVITPVSLARLFAPFAVDQAAILLQGRRFVRSARLALFPPTEGHHALNVQVCDHNVT